MKDHLCLNNQIQELSRQAYKASNLVIPVGIHP